MSESALERVLLVRFDTTILSIRYGGVAFRIYLLHNSPAFTPQSSENGMDKGSPG